MLFALRGMRLRKRVWFRKNNGLWNNDAAADPATGTNGVDIARPFDDCEHPSLASHFWQRPAVTLRTEAAEFTYTGPSGFTSWMGEALAAPPVTGTGTPAAHRRAVSVIGGRHIGAEVAHGWRGTGSTGTGAIVADALRLSAGSGVSASVANRRASGTSGHGGGAGVSASSGAGALAAQAATASGVGAVASAGTGALAAQASTVAGAGLSVSTGSGALQAAAATVAGAGASVSTGTGSLVAGSAEVAGTGTAAAGEFRRARRGSGDGRGLGVSASTGSGALQAGAAAVAGAGLVASVGTR